MLSTPLYQAEEREEEGQVVVIKKPARWSFASAALMLKVSTELATAVIGVVQAGRPIAGLSEAEMDAIEAVMPRTLDEDSGPLEP